MGHELPVSDMQYVSHGSFVPNIDLSIKKKKMKTDLGRNNAAAPLLTARAVVGSFMQSIIGL